MARGLFVGLTTVDIFNVVDTHPLPGQKIKAHHQAVCAGGPAALSASHSCLSYGTRKWISHYNDQDYANEIR